MPVKQFVVSLVPPFLRKYTDRIESSPIGYRLAKGAFWSLAGAVISRGLSLLASIFVARMLGKEGFGELGIIQSTVGMFGIFAGFGMGLTATKHVAEYRTSDPAKAGRVIGISSLTTMATGILISTILFLSAPWLAKHTLAAPHLAGLIRISTGLLLFSAVNGSQTGALAGFEAFRHIARIGLISGLISFPLMIAGSLLYGIQGAVWGLVISMAVNCFLNYLAVEREASNYNIPLGYSNCFKEWPLLWSFSVPAVLAGAMVGPVNWACSAMLVNQPNGYAEMGILNAASQWQALILFVPSTISNSILPVLSHFYSEGTIVNYQRVLWFNIKANGTIALSLAALASIASPWIMQTYGKDFISGYTVLCVMVFSASLSSINSVIGLAIVSSGRLWFGLLFNLLWATTFLLTAKILIPALGALGFSLSMLFAYICHVCWQALYVRKYLMEISS